MEIDKKQNPPVSELRRSKRGELEQTFKVFGVIFVLTLLLVGGVTYLVYYLKAETEKEIVMEKEAVRVKLMEKFVEDFFEEATADLKIIVIDNDLQNYVETGGEEGLLKTQTEWLALATNKDFYSQIRFLDKVGREKIKIVREGEEVIVEDNLEFKGDRYYFADTFELERGEIFVSPFDLNVEEGMLGQLPKPMIRLGMLMFNEAGEKEGIVMLNIDGKDLLADIEDFYQGEGELMLLNSEGYWLKSSIVEDEWGFMYEDRGDRRFLNKYPDVWVDIQSRDGGQWVNGEGMYTFVTIYPLSKEHRSSTGSGGEILTSSFSKVGAGYYHWIAVSLVPVEFLTNEAGDLLEVLWLIDGAILIILLLMSWLLARALVVRRVSEEMTKNFSDMLRMINMILRHDILGKLTGVRYLLESHKKNPKEDTLDLAYKTAGKGIELIKQMKELELDVKRGSKLEKIDINEVLAGVTEENKIPIRISGGAVVKGDEALYSVFSNLIRNAVVYRRTDRMEVNMESDGKGFEIKLVDWGDNIVEGKEKEMFEEGFTYQNTGTAGLGLYIAKKTIERYGGEIKVERNNPKGIIFVIWLPKW